MAINHVERQDLSPHLLLHPIHSLTQKSPPNYHHGVKGDTPSQTWSAVVQQQCESNNMSYGVQRTELDVIENIKKRCLYMTTSMVVSVCFVVVAKLLLSSK